MTRVKREWRAKPVTYAGIVYYDVASAARLLRTTAPKLRQLMGNGTLEWTQFRTNGKLFITAKSIADYKRLGKRDHK